MALQKIKCRANGVSYGGVAAYLDLGGGDHVIVVAESVETLERVFVALDSERPLDPAMCVDVCVFCKRDTEVA